MPGWRRRAGTSARDHRSNRSWGTAARCGSAIASWSAARHRRGPTAPSTRIPKRRPRCLEIIDAALCEAGAALTDVVRTRVFLVDAGDFEAVARAHGARFGTIRPANTTVVVAALLDPAWKVEIEAEAVLDR
jgi:enamine deaminase RidA (YjgF/YER057c/UK114 family)